MRTEPKAFFELLGVQDLWFLRSENIRKTFSKPRDQVDLCSNQPMHLCTSSNAFDRIRKPLKLIFLNCEMK